VSTPVHRNTDSRNCGAKTTVVGQSNVFVNNLLASVQGDKNTHGGGALKATVNDGTVFVNNKKVVLKGSAASPDSLCPPRGGSHCNPKSVGASPNVFACGGSAGGAGGGGGFQDEEPDPTGSELYPDPNAADLDAEEAGVRSNAQDPSADGSTNTGEVGAPAADVQSREQQAMQYYIDRGYTPEQAAGIVGNLTNESGLNPSIVNPNDAGPGRDSEGIAQWNRERLTNLQGFAADRGTSYQDFETQLAFVDHEMRGTGNFGGGSERAAYNRLVATNDPTNAAVAFSKYERYEGHELNLQGAETQKRARDAVRILGNT
jgi:hypothetical protein